jgi:hypothetical protein
MKGVFFKKKICSTKHRVVEFVMKGDDGWFVIWT